MEICSGCIVPSWMCLNIQRLHNFERLVDIFKYADWVQNKILEKAYYFLFPWNLIEYKVWKNSSHFSYHKNGTCSHQNRQEGR